MAEALSIPVDQIKATIYGNCIGDAIGLATEFMVKKDVETHYGKKKHLEYKDIVRNFHRGRWEEGDWTDDSDQMILIMQSLLDKEGTADRLDFASKMKRWKERGFPELGDIGGMGIGATTVGVLRHEKFLTEPHTVAEGIWKAGGCRAAPNGAVMRTSVLGIHEFWDIDKVINNTLEMCAVTHHDPRCKASCVAVTTSIAFMLQKQPKHMKKGKYDISAIMKESFELGKKCLSDDTHLEEFKKHMFAKSLKDLQLAEQGKIGYTYKTMGAGFWALKQDNFRKAIEEIVREAGDADTNGAVAGALLGCKLGHGKGIGFLPDSWLNELKHKAWLDEKLDKFIELVRKMSTETPKEKSSETQETKPDK